MIYVKQHPSADTLCEVSMTEKDGFAPMTNAELEAWIASEKATGWVPVKSVVQVKNERIESIENASSEQTGITVGAVTLAATDSSLLKIIGLMVFIDRATAAGLLKPSDPVTVHDINDVAVELPVTQMNSLLLGFGAQYIAGFKNRKAKLNAIKAAATIEDINAIN